MFNFDHCSQRYAINVAALIIGMVIVLPSAYDFLNQRPNNYPFAPSARTKLENSSSIARVDNNHELRVQEQIENYRSGLGLIINIHITHHAGTTLCATIGKAPGLKGAPTFACMGVRPEDNVTADNYPGEAPWKHDETQENIDIVRQFFHLISWEYNSQPRLRPLNNTDWENPNLVSILVIRHPLSRLLAGDGAVLRKYPHINKNKLKREKYLAKHSDAELEKEWWDFARDDRNDNFALRVLTSLPGCCNGENTTLDHLESAKDLIRRMTFVLDIECLNENFEALADLLNISISVDYSKSARKKMSVEERFPFPEVYEYLRQRNKRDIELYEWAKSLSLVQCDTLNQTRW